MKVRVQLFAVAREIAGNKEISVEVREGATVADVRDAVIAAAPDLGPIVPHARWAVDTQFAADGKVVAATSEIALIPPVSGG
jgi:molybdopterin converting factor small subunit